MPRHHVFNLTTRTGYGRWLAWRARVVQHEERELHLPNNWWHAPSGYCAALQCERKGWFYRRDKQTRLATVLAHRYDLAPFWQHQFDAERSARIMKGDQ